MCPGGCRNGGLCSSPGHCACADGFTGSDCSLDLDECSMGREVHRCGEGATCVNKHGW